jgi:hypothetical protein
MEGASREQIRKAVLVSMLGSFTDVYLTLVSIIQGAVFGYGVIYLMQRWTTLELSQWILVLVTGLFFIAVWQEYVYMSVLFSWVPGIKDAIFPFALGSAELILVSSIPLGVAAWFRAMTVAMAVGVLILANTNWRVHRDKDLNRPQRRVMGEFPSWKGPRGALIAASLQLVLAILLVAISARYDDTSAGRSILALMAATAAGAYYIRLVFYVPNIRSLASD